MADIPPGAGFLGPLARRLNMKEGQLRTLVYLLLLGAAGVLVAQWDWLGAGTQPPGQATPVAAGPRAPGGSGAGAPAPGDELERREAELAAWLEGALSRIAGAGRVKVMLRLEAGPAQVPALESRDVTRTTREQAQDNSQRTTTERDSQSRPVLALQNQPWVLRTEGARVAGVLVVAEGAGQARVAEQLTLAVRTALKLLPNQVTVLPMATGGEAR